MSLGPAQNVDSGVGADALGREEADRGGMLFSWAAVGGRFDGDGRGRGATHILGNRLF